MPALSAPTKTAQLMNDYQAPADLLQDRVILVTGAGDGLGRAAAQAYAAHGATVVLLGKTIRKLEDCYDAIVAAGNPEPAIYPLHMEGAAPQDYEELATKIEENFGRLDGILHNAASIPWLSRVDDYDAIEWVKMLQVNLTAPFLITQACLPLLRRAPDAAVLFTTDTVGAKGKAYWGAYAAAKGGIERFMEVLAAELDNSAIRVNAIDPGPTRTQLRKRLYPALDLNDTPAPESRMPLYLWLMGPDSHGTHGQRLSRE
jgi:NAD(P)-dependent dehydrogenase (short-subunit alcohol dehydrogenase family)